MQMESHTSKQKGVKRYLFDSLDLTTFVLEVLLRMWEYLKKTLLFFWYFDLLTKVYKSLKTWFKLFRQFHVDRRRHRTPTNLKIKGRRAGSVDEWCLSVKRRGAKAPVDRVHHNGPRADPNDLSPRR